MNEQTIERLKQAFIIALKQFADGTSIRIINDKGSYILTILYIWTPDTVTAAVELPDEREIQKWSDDYLVAFLHGLIHSQRCQEGIQVRHNLARLPGTPSQWDHPIGHATTIDGEVLLSLPEVPQ